jgi:hypothetical protein
MYRRTADAGDPYALGLAARLLEDAGRLNEAIGLSRPTPKPARLPPMAGSRTPFGRRRSDEAIEWLQGFAKEARDHGARRQVGQSC